MNTGDALLAACALQPDEHTPQLVFADWLQENGDEDRAELIRLTCEMRQLVPEPALTQLLNGGIQDHLDKIPDSSWADWKGTIARLTLIAHRVRDLEARLSAWPCPECGGNGGNEPDAMNTWTCAACGMGDVLYGLPLRWRAGYPVAVTLPRMTDVVLLEERPSKECPACFGRGARAFHSGRGRGCASCGNHDTVRLWLPTPRLRALCQTPPWGVPLEAVMVGDREPVNPAGKWLWLFTEPVQASAPVQIVSFNEPFRLPDCLRPHMPDVVFDTIDAARLALGRAIYQFGRTHAD